MTVLVCPCGARVKAPGAIPGRVGRCPSCGGTLRVPASPQVEPAGYALERESAPPRQPARRPRPRRVSAFRPREPRTEAGRSGLIPAPSRPERSLAASLAYPLWDGGGLSMLVFAPPVLLVTSMFSVGLRGYLQSGDEVTVMGSLTLAFPMLCGLIVAMGYAMTLLGAMLEASARGEVFHPRWPPWEPPEVLGALFRWGAAALPGLVASGLLAGLFGSRFTTPLKPIHESAATAILGAGLALMPLPLAAAVLHRDARSANPLAMVQAYARAGPGALGISLLFGATGAAFLAVVPLLYQLPGVLAPIVAAWLYWVAACYAAMVLVRRLGLFYARHAESLGWFPDRPRWGAR
jgi:hypothetical protein